MKIVVRTADPTSDTGMVLYPERGRRAKTPPYQWHPQLSTGWKPVLPVS